jgi:hypothetical protein
MAQTRFTVRLPPNAAAANIQTRALTAAGRRSIVFTPAGRFARFGRYVPPHAPEVAHEAALPVQSTSSW